VNIPNVLTVSRIFLTAFFVYFILQEGLSSKIIASSIFLVASLTDLLDGYLAKKWNLITNFGKLMDPIADKLLTLAAFYVFARMHVIAFWMFGLIAFREVFVTIWRLVAMRRGKFLAAETLGKYKTFSQMVAIIVTLIFLVWVEIAQHPMGQIQVWMDTISALMGLAVLLTLSSGIMYFWNNRKHLYG
jgi:CDP-diacylglycerol--glycerol-3-phosphate 3-phosphatidyltransferase